MVSLTEAGNLNLSINLVTEFKKKAPGISPSPAAREMVFFIVRDFFSKTETDYILFKITL